MRAETAIRVAQLRDDRGIAPGLAVLLVGDNPASASYVRGKERACEEAGIYTETLRPPATSSQSQLVDAVAELNTDNRFHGILVQLPLPDHVDEDVVLRAIDPAKDVDGLHPYNLGLLLSGSPRFVPATPLGVQRLLVEEGVELEGATVVICGRSNIVGRPLAALLVQKAPHANATVTVCHTGTRDLPSITRRADILIAAIGRPGAITGDMIRPGAVVIDVGISRVEDASKKRGYRLDGDVAFDEAVETASLVTPVPGGVGPMTIAMLLTNTMRAARLAIEAKATA